MSTIDEIKKMQGQNKSDQDIINVLQAQGIPRNEIMNALSHTKIKDAVSDSGAGVPSQVANQESSNANMQPSMLAQQNPEATPIPSNTAPGQETIPAPKEQQPAVQETPSPGQEYDQSYADAYYQPQGISADTITEITEQIISERLNPLKTNVESALDFKDAIDSKIDYLNERLQRMEKIIDRLQLSILQKVGEYATNVEDIKKEISETQKSFKALVPKIQEKPSKEK